ncbi:MAG TPA: hypothetical protein VLQ93_15235 [Myxococcaceae bacterium]|nr:hypothetical protein [Myxococcaceae bacterium]
MSPKVMERYTGGRKPMLTFAGAGMLGLAVTALGWGVDTRRALFSWLFAYAYWVGLAVAALILLGTWHASRARWPVVLRRMLETMAGTLPLLALLFLPILLGAHELFLWTHETPPLSEHELELLRHKQPYLNLPFWGARAALYFALWIAVSELLLRWSRRQDESGELKLTTWQRRLGAGSLPAVAVALSFASLDWLLSLEPLFVSTIFGLYYFAGAFVGVLAALTLATLLARGPRLYGTLTNPSHLASLGKFLLAFTVFWAYIAYCQYFLIWIANLPAEVGWYIKRTTGAWEEVALAVVVGRFILPFFVLLSRPLKQSRALLGVVAGWLLVAHALDVYWLVLPVVEPEGPALHWADVAAFVGVGGSVVAFALWRLRGHATLPVGDPYLYESLGYDE